jgi:hypothetical protein
MNNPRSEEATPLATARFGSRTDTTDDEETHSPPFDAAEALRAGWLELWYQPKIHARTLALHEAEVSSAYDIRHGA